MTKKKLTKAEKLAQTPIEEFMKMPLTSLRGIEKTLRYGYTRRVQSFNRKNLVSHAQIAFEASAPAKTPKANSKGKKGGNATSGQFSQTGGASQAGSSRRGSVQSTGTNKSRGSSGASSGNSNPFNRPDLAERNRLIMDIARYAKFFNDETSSEAGIRKVQREQDIRIFGTDKKGNPLYSMNNEERSRYWALYEEYLNQNPTATSRYDSNRIQNMLGSMMFNQNDTSTNEFEEMEDDTTITGLLNNLEKRLAKQKAQIDMEEGSADVYRGRGGNFSK